MNHRNWFLSRIRALHNLGGLRRGAVMLAAAVCLLATPALAQLQYTVNNASDPGTGTATNCPVNSSATGPGSCTLRDALAAANASASSNQAATIIFDPSLTASGPADIKICTGCGPYQVSNYIGIVGSSGSNPVELDGTSPSGSTVSMVIQESSGLLTLFGNLFIMNGGGTGAWPGGGGGGGNAGGVEIDGGVFFAANVTFLNNLGLSGGAIYNNSSASINASPTVQVVNCIFEFNSTGITSNQGNVLVQNSTFFENAAGTYSGSPISGEAGGGIWASNTTLSVQNSSFLNNTNYTSGLGTEAGGAIALTGGSGVLAVSGSTFAYNSAVTEGGAVYIGPGLGAWFTDDTFYQNSVQTYNNNANLGGGSGIFGDSSSQVTILQSTLNDAGGGAGSYVGIYGLGNLAVVNSLTYDFVIYGNWLNFTGTVYSDPPISGLGNYGGSTQTIMPLPSGTTASAAICGGVTTNLGNDAAGSTISLPQYDQRGYTRVGSVGGLACVDAGAVQTLYSLNWTASPSDPQQGGTTMTASTSPTTTYPAAQLLDHNTAIALAGATPSAALRFNTLGGTTTETTNASGIATFNALTSPHVTTAISNEELFVGIYAGPGPGGTTVWNNYPSASFDIVDLALPPTTLAAGTVAVSYSQTINPATGGEGTIAYTVTGGALPQGLSLSRLTGAITGTPSAATTGASFTITATDGDGDTATQNYSIAIAQGTPTVTWATPAAITYGTALSSTQLNASSTVSGNFSYTPAAGTVLTVGTKTLSVLFTPNDTADYTTATQTVQLVVNQATPSITWATPAAITYGTALSSTQLNATSTVSGAFKYTPAAGTVLGVGTQTLSVTLTPNDTVDYTNATQTVQLVVSKGTPAVKITLTAGSNPVFQGNNVTFTATVALSSPGGTVATPSGTVTFYNGSTALCSTVTMSGGAATCTTNTLAQGANVIAASYSGDSNYNSVAYTASTSLTETVLGLLLTPAEMALTVIPGGSAVYTINVSTTPSGSTSTFPAPVTFTVTCTSCAGGTLPTGVTAGFNFTSLSTAGPLTLTIQTTTQASMTPATSGPGIGKRLAPLALALLLLPFARRLRKASRRLSQIGLALLLAVLSLAVATGVSGCGSNVGFFGSAQQTYTVLVTATSGSYTDTTTVTVTVE